MCEQSSNFNHRKHSKVTVKCELWVCLTEELQANLISFYSGCLVNLQHPRIKAIVPCQTKAQIRPVCILAVHISQFGKYQCMFMLLTEPHCRYGGTGSSYQGSIKKPTLVIGQNVWSKLFQALQELIYLVTSNHLGFSTLSIKGLCFPTFLISFNKDLMPEQLLNALAYNVHCLSA